MQIIHHSNRINNPTEHTIIYEDNTNIDIDIPLKIDYIDTKKIFFLLNMLINTIG